VFESYDFGRYHNEFGYIHVDLLVMLEGLFLVASILISFGAVIGKVSPLQLVVMTFFECIFYSVNTSMLMFGVADLVDGN
jgi:ammonium transporter Rh